SVADGSRVTSLSCRGLWKIFGHGAEELLRHNPHPDAETLAAAWVDANEAKWKGWVSTPAN
ncbi:MAG TPA: hypothetical protein VIE35_17870, partial [Dongiaceae bacterium]